mmetsp:Transcript_89444/g.148676  ORF Transcript_89444/g.148676 Transcript_89444/m.148676 type:complete len:91 (+) Transcript_89444:567-839(+)
MRCSNARIIRRLEKVHHSAAEHSTGALHKSPSLIVDAQWVGIRFGVRMGVDGLVSHHRNSGARLPKTCNMLAEKTDRQQPSAESRNGQQG